MSIESIPEEDNSHLSLVDRRPWTHRTNRQLPTRYREVLPQPPSALPPTSMHSKPTAPLAPLTASTNSMLPYEPHIITTPRNAFGLLRRYELDRLPIYDPEEYLLPEHFTDFTTQAQSIGTHSNPFAPYPNRSSFLLGDWFWNCGVQKSLGNFKALVSIIVDPDFTKGDITDVKWDHINKTLGSDDCGEWLDDDAGWEHTSISISVPYQIRRGVSPAINAGPKNYTVDDYHHRSIISVICEKILGLKEGSQFHFQPYELLWQKVANGPSVHVQGELYSAPVFLAAHRELQSSPPQPNCDLQRVVIALMFWSDATHLAAFGPAKLWPLYMFFGNESKYQRCKPSCHTCEHIAYFQSVCLFSNSMELII